MCVCLSVCPLDYSGSDFNEIFWKGGVWPRTNRLDFGGDPNHDPDPEFFK